VAPYPVHPGALEAYEDADVASRLGRESADDVQYYVRLARGAGDVLEYGAGRGRVTLPMARAGAGVVAVDLSTQLSSALESALQSEPAQVRRRVTVKRGDMRSLRLGRKFRLVVAPSDTFSHLYSRGDVEGFLACAHAHLVAGGQLVFDVAMPRLPRIEDLGGASDDAERTDYDPIAQVLSTWCEAGDRSVLLARRLFFPRELELLLTRGGFGTVRLRAVSRKESKELSRLRVSCRALAAKKAVTEC
jgi:SAM-dependent methyltransferase